MVLLLFASFPIACFTCALLTDLAYAATANTLWADFSDWLLAAGMAGGVVALIAGLAMLVAGRAWTRWPMALGFVLVLAIALLNNLVHSRDGWTSVMPTGLALSVVTVLLILATLWLGGRRRNAITVTEYRR